MSVNQKQPLLREQIGSVIASVDQLAQQMKDKAAPLAVRAVPEADALASCMRALSALDESTRTSGATYNYNPSRNDGGSIGRVLRYLADRYSVRLVEEHVAPCSRRHADEIDLSAIYDVLNRVVVA